MARYFRDMATLCRSKGIERDHGLRRAKISCLFSSKIKRMKRNIFIQFCICVTVCLPLPLSPHPYLIRPVPHY